MSLSSPPRWGSVDLYWIPLGADAHVVRISGTVFEIVSAFAHRRSPCALFHSALQVYVPEGRFVIEQAPVPDLHSAVASPLRRSHDLTRAQRVLDVLPAIPTPVWGRDELHLGEMWNSNSVIAWVLASSGCDIAGVNPPKGGRAPGWDAGIVAAACKFEHEERHSPTVHAPSG